MRQSQMSNKTATVFISESESVDFSAAVTEDYYAEAWVLV